ncbi:YlcI/YnfO family protein [Escherichia coli]|nr:YlcI/YnfO family protein [Escherichia coli]
MCWLHVLSLQHQSHGFPNQMIEQINIALEQKGSGNFSAWVIEACRRRLTSEKRAYTSIKSDEE